MGQKEVHRDYRLVRLNGTCQIYDFFCTKVVQNVAKQMPVNLVQDDVKYQGKYVLCRGMHFGHITAGNYRRRFLSNSNWKNLQQKLAPGSKLVQK